MKTVSIHDAKTNLSKYIAAAKRGEKIYVGSFGKSEVELVPTKDTKTKRYPKKDQEKVQRLWAELQALKPFKDINDPVAWQREIRKDRPLPGRD